MTRRSAALLLLTLLLPPCLAACASEPVQIREYVLTQAAGAGSVDTGVSSPAAGDLAIGVGPVRLPRYLRRSQIVTRVGANELRTSDTNRWGEDLDRGLARVVAEDLAVLVPTTHAVAFPWRDAAPMDYRVSITVRRFERAPDGAVVLEAQWDLSRPGEANPLVRRTSEIREASEGPSYAEAVGAMSAAAGRMSREIAEAIREQAAAAGTS